MKINWKVIIALALAIGTAFWALTSLLTSSYSGSNLNFGVGSGTVTVTNPSDEPVPAQFVGSRSRSFTVSSTIEGVSGSATREGTGSSSIYIFEFELPPGTSEFTIARGTEVNFVSETATRLQARVNPLSADSARTTIIVALVVVAGALFYASKSTGHAWLRALRPQKTSVRDTRPIAVADVDEMNRGRDGRMYSDT